MIPVIIVPILLLLILGGYIENTFTPRIDIADDIDRSVYLWYNDSGRRENILLFKLK